MAKIVPLSTEYEFALIRKAQGGDAVAMERLVAQYEPLVSQFATSMKLPSYDRCDNRQVVRTAIVEAVQDFDFARDVKLITYVYRMIDFSIRSLLKNMNRDKRKIVFSPTVSLDHSLTGGDHNDDTPARHNVLSNNDHLVYAEIDTKSLLGVLNMTEIKVVWFMCDKYSTEDIAEMINKTPERVEYIKTNIKKKLSIYSTENQA